MSQRTASFITPLFKSLLKFLPWLARLPVRFTAWCLISTGTFLLWLIGMDYPEIRGDRTEPDACSSEGTQWREYAGRIERELADSKGACNRLQISVENLEVANQDLTRKLKQAAGDSTKRQTESRAKEDDLMKQVNGLETRLREEERKSAQIKDKATASLREKDANIAKIQSQLEQQIRYTAQVENDQRRLDALLREERVSSAAEIVSYSRQLEGARTYLSTADRHSEGEIIQMALDLNLRIENTAENIALSSRAQMQHTPDDKQVQVVRQFLGTTMADSLLKRKDPEDRTLLDAALQCVLVQWCVELAMLWCPSCPNEDGVMRKVYKEIRILETQAVASQWRALAYKQLQRTISGDSNAKFVQELLSRLQFVLLVAGYTPDFVGETLKGDEERFHQMLLDTRRLGNALLGGMVSADFEVYNVLPESTVSLSEADDAHGNKEPRDSLNNERILCTMHFGLRKLAQTGRRSNPGEGAEKILLKPKVAFESVINILEADMEID